VKCFAVGVLAACVLACVLALPASAEGVDRATYLRLVAAAGSDPAALARLRGVTAVDGLPVDLQRVLSGSTARVRARLAALRAAQPARPRDPAAARRSAAAILAGAGYRPSREGLFARALSWIGRKLRIPTGAAGLPGLIVLALVLAGVGGLVALVLGTLRRSQRRARSFQGENIAFGVGAASPEELERRAAAAEAAGRLEEAMRLQLAAALTRLDAAGTIHVRRDTTLGQVSKSLGSRDFDLAADRFAGVVYGRRPPTSSDAAELRERLSAALQEAGSR
jgi:hypothetical protein